MSNALWIGSTRYSSSRRLYRANLWPLVLRPLHPHSAKGPQVPLTRSDERQAGVQAEPLPGGRLRTAGQSYPVESDVIAPTNSPGEPLLRGGSAPRAGREQPMGDGRGASARIRDTKCSGVPAAVGVRGGLRDGEGCGRDGDWTTRSPCGRTYCVRAYAICLTSRGPRGFVVLGSSTNYRWVCAGRSFHRCVAVVSAT